MTRRTRPETIQTFTVSWFPIYAKEAATIRCISREGAARCVAELKESFARYQDHDPVISVDRGKARVTS